MYESDNPYLNGNYAPWREESDAFDLEIEGELPRELNGALYRIGPNPHFKPLGRYHWFDGDGMVHAFILRDGRAAYRNRYVRTDGLKAEMKQGRALFGGLLEQPREMPPEVPPFKNAGEHQHHRIRRPPARAVRSRIAARAQAADARDRRAVRFRRQADRPGHGASEVRSRHRRPAVLRLPAVPAVRDVVPRESRRQADRVAADRHRTAGDDARFYRDR